MQSSVHGFVGNDHGAAFQPDTAAGAYPEEHGIYDFGVEHQFDGFVQEDAHRRHAHSVLRTENTDQGKINIIYYTMRLKYSYNEIVLTLIHKTGPTLYIEYLYEYRLMSCNVVPVGILYDISSISL